MTRFLKGTPFPKCAGRKRKAKAATRDTAIADGLSCNIHTFVTLARDARLIVVESACGPAAPFATPNFAAEPTLLTR
jgi:hypothetical protein